MIGLLSRVVVFVRHVRFPKAELYVYGASLLLSLQFFLTLYVTSSYLASFVGKTYVGLFYGSAALIALVWFLVMPQLIVRVGIIRAIVWVTTAHVFAALGLSISNQPALIVLCFLMYASQGYVLGYGIDVLLTLHAGNHKTMGQKRGLLITAANIAAVIAPTIVGVLLSFYPPSIVFLCAAFLLIPFTFVIGVKLAHTNSVTVPRPQFLDTLRCTLTTPPLRLITALQLLLQVFYSWMVVYTPLYLVAHLGMSWATFGVLMSVALSAFLLTEYPAGIIADSILGEKEILVTGFIILVLTVGLMSSIDSTSALVWGAVLFATRIGASFVEIATESYFFKHVDAHDLNSISLFRMMQPLSYCIGPVVATIALLMVPIESVFLVFACILIIGIGASLTLVDTR